MGISAFVLGWSLNEVFGENYIANLTGEEWQEYKLTELCYTMDGSELTVELLDEFCNERYGDIDNLYGERIK